MGYFAKIDENNIVISVIVADQNFIDSGVVGDASLWVETSKEDGFRKQYAGGGYTYDKVNDVFIRPKIYASWKLNADFDWEAPIAKPDDGKTYQWNEETTTWDETNLLPLAVGGARPLPPPE